MLNGYSYKSFLVKISFLFHFFLETLLKQLLPLRCLLCRASSQGTERLCNACWVELDFIEEACCACCGFPLDMCLEKPLLCGSCAMKLPPFDVARAVFAYTEASKGLILPFKHADRLEATPLFGVWLERVAKPYVHDAHFILSVPLHWSRLWRRQYNQAALLAKALGRRVGTPVYNSALKRLRRTQSQGKLTVAQREKNVKGAFAISKRYKERLKGKTVILVDDVYTTGATVRACAALLKAIGVKRVVVITLARALKGR